MPQTPIAQYPETTLQNGRLTARIMLPDAEHGFYRGPRFDWASMIAQVEYQDHTFFGEWKAEHDPLELDHGIGPAEEFGSAMFGFPPPLGFNEAKVNGSFLKIAAGVLTKPQNEQYLFYRAYPLVDPGTWQISQGPDWIEFRHQLTLGGWGYAYTRRISLAADGAALVIDRALRNTGELPIVSSHYAHNFIRIDDDPIGPDYVVRFPFAPRVEHTMNGYAAPVDQDVWFVKAFDAKGVIPTALGGFEKTAAMNTVLVENRRTGAAVRITGSAPVAMWYFFAVRTAVCPEAFVRLECAPGAEVRWQTVYAFSVAP